MFEPGTVTYGFAKNISNPKYKYAISIFRDANVQVVIHFTTSQRRAGVPDAQIQHGINRDTEGNVVSYVLSLTGKLEIPPTAAVSNFLCAQLCSSIMVFCTATI